LNVKSVSKTQAYHAGNRQTVAYIRQEPAFTHHFGRPPPFLIVAGHYPPRVRGVNKRGMVRAGLSEEQQQRVTEAYKELYRRGSPLLVNARELARQDELDENVRAMVDAIFKSNEHRFGRYRESLRTQ
jgi:UDP-N-acetylglucosamine acyltransferase